MCTGTQWGLRVGWRQGALQVHSQTRVWGYSLEWPFGVLIDGLWGVGVVNKAGQVLLLTVEANETFGKIHHRMPLFLGEEEVDAWIDPASDYHSTLRPMIDLASPTADKTYG